MDTAAQWPQDIVTYPKQPSVERKATSRPHKEQVFNCPRCNSTNTKFCYYNNYSLSQPRYFCKTCRRYWTEGGSLRNIPVGGGSRKNKRSSSSSSSLSPNSSSSTRNNAITPSKKLPDLVIPQQQQPNPNHNKIQLIENNQDLNLGFSILSHHNDLKAINEMIRVPNFDKDLMQNPSSSSSLELLNNNRFATTTTSASSSRGLMSSFMSIFPPVVSTNNASGNVTDPISTAYSSSSGFSSLMMPEFKSSDLNFSIDGLGSNYESFQGVQEQINGKLLFPFEDLKNQDSSNENDARREESRSDHHQQQHGDHANGNYWNGVIGGGSW